MKAWAILDFFIMMSSLTCSSVSEMLNQYFENAIVEMDFLHLTHHGYLLENLPPASMTLPMYDGTFLSQYLSQNSVKSSFHLYATHSVEKY